MASVPEAAAPARRPRLIKLLLPELIVGGLAFGIANHWSAPWVARVLGRATGHDPTWLALIGWCFGGLPWLLGGVIVFARPRLMVRGVVPHVFVVWIAANATVIPAGRHSTGSVARRLFASHATDGLPIAWGVAMGLAGFAVAFLGIGLVVGVLRGHGPFQHRSKAMLGAIQTWYLGGCVAGLVVALTVTAPGSG